MNPSCQSPEDRLIRDLERRVTSLETELSGFQELMGVSTSADGTIVPILSISSVVTGPNTVFTIVFFSAPGDQFQVQSSTDLVTWTSLASPLAAAASPALSTTWVSGSYTIDQLPVYFRVRKFPVLFQPCAVPVSCPA